MTPLPARRPHGDRRGDGGRAQTSADRRPQLLDIRLSVRGDDLGGDPTLVGRCANAGPPISVAVAVSVVP